MAEKKAKKKREKPRRTKNLSFILWFTFSLFAVSVILIYGVVQNVLLGEQTRDQAVRVLRSAGTALSDVIESNPNSNRDDIGNMMLSLANEYNVSAYLISADGETIYPKIPTEDREQFLQIYETVRGYLGDSKGQMVIFEPVPNVIASSVLIDVNGESDYLYISRSLSAMGELMSHMRWLSVLMGLFIIVLAFVASGYVSMIITKPVTEVTEKAKELARGNYDVKFQENYFCTEIRELSEALDYAGSEISKADQMQKELIANVSHDFKTPLTMIKAYASMIQEISGENPEKRMKHTQIIIDESDRLAALVNDLLDLSKLRAGVFEQEESVFNLSEEVYLVAGRFHYLTENGGYVIETDIDDELYTKAGKPRIDQVLYNLIGNAVNYTGEDKRVIVRLKRREGVARFEVTDTGKGIPQEEIATVWERYYRSSETHKRPVRGTGLGLSIVKGVLTKHGFPFGILSEVGKGSTFWVEFPMPPETETVEK